MSEKGMHHAEQDVIMKARGFWMNYSKPITYIGSAVILVLGGWLVYKYMFKLPEEAKANDAVFVTQNYFNSFSSAPNDSSKIKMATIVINGDGRSDGALRIIDKYSGTSAANLCEFYAGACYLSLGQFEKAVKYLKDFNAGGATQIQSRADGMIGDAYAELKKNDDALDYYKKAASVNEKDDFTSSEYLFRAALFAETIGKTKDAIELFTKIKTDYPTNQKAADVDRYLAKLGDFSE